MSRNVHREASAPTTSRHSEQHDPEYPMTVRQAAQFLGVSPQTVYLWVE